MLGSDPIAALLGAGIDPRSPQVVWKGYLRRLVTAGCAVTMTGPDVHVPAWADAETIAALAELVRVYPSGMPMPPVATGKLAGAGQVDSTADRVNSRVGAYFRLIARVVGKERAPDLLEAGAITASAGLHVGRSHMAAVIVPDAEALEVWRRWAVEASGDRHEQHAAPTVLIPSYRGGGVFLFRTPATVAVGEPPTVPGFSPLGPVSLTLEGCRIVTGEVTVPLPPTRIAGRPVMRLGPCRMLPPWLEQTLRANEVAAAA